MASKKMMLVLFQVLVVVVFRQTISPAAVSAQQSSALFREYIGAEFVGVKFSDVPINHGVEFHFILAFAIDYTADGSSSTDGQFNVFWDSGNLSPAQVAAVKQNNSNVRVALSLGGDSVHGNAALFKPSSVDAWVGNAVNSLTGIIRQYNLDGIDVDYEHFSADPDTFAECIGKLVTTLKNNGVISFASIAPFDDEQVQNHYRALWNRYGNIIDYVNFQFYAYSSSTTASQFLTYFKTQTSNYHGGRVLVSLGSSDNSGGLSPGNGFFSACLRLKTEGELQGIFVWSADDSLGNSFRYETTAQNLLAAAR